MRLAILTILLPLSFNLAAKENIPQELFKSILALTKTEEIMESAKSQCIETPSYPTAAELLVSDPNYFGGINQHSSKWEAIVKLHKEFELRSCEYLEPTKLARAYSRKLLENYTVDEAKELKKLLESDLGRKFVYESLKANEYLQAKLSKQTSSAGIELNKWYVQKIQEIITRPAQPRGPSL